MEVLKYLKQLYTGKGALAGHIGIFSLAGIFVILFIKYTAAWGNMILYNNFFISVPSSNYELWLYLFFGILIGMYFIGCGWNIMSNVVNNREILLPELSLSPFCVFVKTIPVVLFWNFIYACVCIAGVFLLRFLKISSFYYIFASVMLCIAPFLLVVISIYTKDFMLRKEIFDIRLFFRALEKTLGRVILFSVEMFILSMVTGICIYKFLTYPLGKDFEIIHFAIKLGGLCTSGYWIIVMIFLYCLGIASITKDTFFKPEN